MSNLTTRLHAGRHLARRAQRGAVALAVSMLLLFATTLGVLHLNRGLIFDQRTSANQMKSTLALETAEAGIEWAAGMLNSPFDVGTNCQFLTTANISFRKRYVLTRWSAVPSSSDVAAATNTFPGCRLTPTGLACSCPAVPASGEAVAALDATVTPSFTVAFASVPGDPESVKVTSRGCTSYGSVCTAANAPNADANSVISVTLKLRPLLRAAPAAPLTCGKSCSVGGSYNLINTDVGTNGVLVNAGGAITTANGTSLSTVPGVPAANALVGNDASLASLANNDPTCANSGMFNAYFGTTIEKYRDSPSTKELSCSSAADCKNKLTNAYDDGWRAFYFATDLHLSGNQSLGSSSDPVTIVTPNAIDINGTWDIYGMVFSNSANFNSMGTGSATIHGAQIACADYQNNGNGSTTYDADALKNSRRLTGLMVRVPGSWRDF